MSDMNSLLKVIGAILGIVVSLITIFVFVTGIEHLNERSSTAPPAIVITVQVPEVSSRESEPAILVVTATPVPQYESEPFFSIPTATPIPPSGSISSLYPRIYNFQACSEPCNGHNGKRSFPGGTKKIYVQWDYDDIPVGADYMRIWRMDGKEWVKYICSWPGPSSGTETNVTLTEPGGLHSGTWEIVIKIDGNTLLREQIEITGNWNYWDYTGVFYSCYGKR